MFQRTSILIVAFLLVLIFPINVFAYNGSITVSNVTYDNSTKELSFTKNATYNWFANYGTVTLYDQTQGGIVGYASYTDSGYNCGYNNAPCNVILSHGFNVSYNLSDTFYITFEDGNYSYISNTFTLVNFSPQINQFSGETINVGDTYTTNGSFADTDSISWTATVDYGDGTNSQQLILNGMNFSLNHQYVATGIYSVTVSITDNQGATGIKMATVTVAPTTTIGLSQNNRGSYADPTTVTLSAIAAPGFTIVNTFYTVDNGSQKIYTSPFAITGEGSHTIIYWSIDNAGNQEAANIKNFTIIYDGMINVSDVTYNDSSKELSFYKDATRNFFVSLGTIRLYDQTQGSRLVGYATYTDLGYNCTYNNGPCDIILSHGFDVAYNPLDAFYLTFNDGNYSYSSNTFTLIPPNAPPYINTIPNATLNEGQTYQASGSFTDPDSTSWAGTVDYGDGSPEEDLTINQQDKTFSLNHLYKDNKQNNAPHTVTVTIADNQGAFDTKTAEITVNNVAPNVGNISVSVNPVQVNTSITATAGFTDQGVLDTHTASWDWGDGNTTIGTVTESNGSGSISDSHIYTTAGVYEITLTVTDNSNANDSGTYQYLSVYNPSPQGLFTGVRKFDSPFGAVPGNPTLTGQVMFGITTKYDNQNQPTGNVSMNFNEASLEFEATTITVLVTANSKATLRGTGTINGSGNYTFLVTGLDGGPGVDDFVRFQIKDGSTIIYDSQPSAVDTADPTVLVTAGQVIVH